MIFTEQQLERFSKPPFKYESKQVIDTHFDKEAIQKKYDLGVLPDLF